MANNSTPFIDEAIREYASTRQQQAIDALWEHGNVGDAAASLGISPGRFRGLLSEARRRAALRGQAPENDLQKPVAEGFFIKRVSSHYVQGELNNQWVISEPEKEHQLARVLEAIHEAAEAYAGIAAPTKAPCYSDDELMCVYPFGDPHIGLYAWAEETGDRDFDLVKAEQVMFDAADHLVSLAPAAKRGVVISLGDIFHADNPSNRTARSGHALDVDTRYAKVYRVAVQTMVRVIDRALEKHEIVDVISVIGNHDDVSAYTLAVCLSAWYRNEPRVQVDLTPGKFHFIRHGRCFIGATHGDTVKPAKLPGIMAADRPVDWGATKHRHWYVGHVHHDSLAEFPGVTVETLRTLAPRDAWAAGAGYRSGQDLKLDIWHEKFGLVNRHVCGVERLVAA